MSGEDPAGKGDPGPEPESLQRRRRVWPEGVVRQRRRVREDGPRRGRPRLMAGTVIALVALILLDLTLAAAAWTFARRQRAATERARAGIQRWAPAAPTARPEPDGLDLLMALVHQQAQRDQGLNLSVSVASGTMDLQRQGASLRRMKVVPGPDSAAGLPPGASVPRPRGKRRIARIVDEEFVWWVPRWVFSHRGLTPPAESARSVRGGLGPLALILDDGSLIYSLPAEGPLSDPAYVMPGTLRADVTDLQAIRDNLRPGLPVYVH